MIPQSFVVIFHILYWYLYTDTYVHFIYGYNIYCSLSLNLWDVLPCLVQLSTDRCDLLTRVLEYEQQFLLWPRCLCGRSGTGAEGPISLSSVTNLKWQLGLPTLLSNCCAKVSLQDYMEACVCEMSEALAPCSSQSLATQAVLAF